MDEPSKNNHRYGNDDIDVVLVHGGPGAAGELAPLATLLATLGYGVLEPWQTATTVEGQIAELHTTLKALTTPIYLMGWSWGAWLALLVAARYPDHIRRLVLIGSGPFEAQYAKSIQPTRRARLSVEDNAALPQLLAAMDDPAHLSQVLEIFDKCDTFNRDASPQPQVEFNQKIHENVWAEAARLRQEGALVDALERLRCRVTAIHGDHDPHPADGVRVPLEHARPDAAFHLFEQCGHKPWQEVHAKKGFLTLLQEIMPKDRIK